MSAPRLHILDAARGVLAAAVVWYHMEGFVDPPAFLHRPLGWWIVAAFWALSGYVLAIGWNGDMPAFLARRAVRLWPVFALGTVAGAALLGRLPTLAELTWWPTSLAGGGDALPDPPAWSLYIELYATPFLPLMFRAARSSGGALLLVAACVPLALTAHLLDIPLCFAVGVAATRLPIRWPQRVPAPLVWLGTISYSLYLTHHAVMAVAGPVLGAVLAFPVAWGVWWLVERPSIAWSRAAGRAVARWGIGYEAQEGHG